MDPETLSAKDTHDLEQMTKAIVEVCVGNTGLEDLHAGRFPVSRTGDFRDVTVRTPDGDIAWTELSRISDPEMKALMIEVVDRVFTYMRYPEVFAAIPGGRTWNRPKLDENLMKTVRRRLEAREGAIWIATATLDRFLQSIGRTQIYGTQLVVSFNGNPFG